MNFMQRFMYGRYGPDQLSFALLVGFFLLNIIARLTDVGPVYWVSLVFAAIAVYRFLSHNIERRRRENAKFLSIANPILRWARMQRTIRSDKEHAYFKCPNCGQYLRVPRGKGKITVTCRACGVSFEEKS